MNKEQKIILVVDDAIFQLMNIGVQIEKLLKGEKEISQERIAVHSSNSEDVVIELENKIVLVRRAKTINDAIKATIKITKGYPNQMVAVILDLTMPFCGGIEAAKSFSDVFPELVPIVLVNSAIAGGSIAEQLQDLGYQHITKKPPADEFIEHLIAILKKSNVL